MKLEMAKFLQDTVEEISLQKEGAESGKVHEFKNFMEKVRNAIDIANTVSPPDLMAVLYDTLCRCLSLCVLPRYQPWWETPLKSLSFRVQSPKTELA